MIVALIAGVFALYAFFDCLTILVRIAAASQGQNAIGASFEKMANTIKRIFVFCYPPFLGLLVVQGDRAGMLVAIFLSYLAAAIVVAMVMTRLDSLARSCVAFSEAYTARMRLVPALAEAVTARPARTGAPHDVRLAHLRRHPRIYLLSALIYFVYGSSIFLLNFLSLAFVDSAPVLLQLTGLINGVGTLLLSFVVDPFISRRLDRNEEVEALATIVLSAQLTAFAVLGPLLFAILSAV